MPKSSRRLSNQRKSPRRSRKRSRRSKPRRFRSSRPNVMTVDYGVKGKPKIETGHRKELKSIVDSLYFDPHDVLNLNGEPIYDEHMKYIGDVLATKPNLKELYLGNNKFTSQGIQYLSNALKSGKIKDLSHLSLSSDQFEDDDFAPLYEHFHPNAALSTLVGLSLQGGHNAINMVTFRDAIEQGGLTSLESLKLSGHGKGNGINDDDVRILASLIEDKKLPSLKRLKLSFNNIANFQAFSPAMLVQLEELDLFDNKITDLPEEYISHLSHLNELSLILNRFSEDDKTRLAVRLPNVVF